jgi:hypothetical protein
MLLGQKTGCGREYPLPACSPERILTPCGRVLVGTGYGRQPWFAVCTESGRWKNWRTANGSYAGPLMAGSPPVE